MENNHRIDKVTFTAMMIVAGIFDLISLIPGVNIISKIVAQIIYFVWFYIKGVVWTKNPKMFTNVIGTTIVGIIPVISVLPEQMFNVYRITILSRLEDGGVKSPAHVPK